MNLEPLRELLAEKARLEASGIPQTESWQKARTEQVLSYAMRCAAFIYEHGEDLSRALLPRTEAAPVADGAVAWMRDVLGRDKWREVHMGKRCMQLAVTYDAQTWEHFMAEVERFTHPHDASSRDAERYRWLRDNRRAAIPEFQSGWDVIEYVDGGEREYINSAQSLDDAIDAAMTSTTKDQP